MKKLFMFLCVTLAGLMLVFLSGCEKSSDASEYGVIGIEIISPVEGDSAVVGSEVNVTTKLTGYTYEYYQINYYFGDNEIPAAIYSKAQLAALSETQQENAEYSYNVSTIGLTEGDFDLRVEAVSTDMRVESAFVPVRLVMPTSDDTTLDMTITSPAENTEFKIGDIIEVQVTLDGNLTLFETLEAFVGNSTTPLYSSNTADETKTFSFPTEDYGTGVYSLRLELTMKDESVKIRTLSFSLIEYIPTFTTALGAAGYSLKSVIQTYDGGYLAVSSGNAGTRVVKYSKEEGSVEWSTDIPASTGIAESVCEDTEYDKGYVLAGWRNNGTDKDTWVRKINQTNGALIWNKTYGYFGVDDGATVIKKSVDDGYIVGGYTYNIWGTDSLIFSGDVNTVRTTWETGYDVRVLKVYSNGNEIWGYNVGYVGQKMWQDISLHKLDDYLWVRKMGDQMITDLIVKDDGNYLVTGWNNWRLYYEDGTDKKDMFFAEIDNFGQFVSTMTWSRMGSGDFGNMGSADDPYGTILNISLLGANHIGDYAEEEASYGFVTSQGGLGGEVVMVGETNQTDTKARLQDAWVVEFTISGDEDGAIWEYSFGETAKNDKASGIDKTKDGGYIVTGYSTGSGTDTWLFKLDAQMNPVWSKNLGVTGDDQGVKVLQTKDGGYIIGSNVGTGTGVQSKLIKVNKTGDQPAK